MCRHLGFLAFFLVPFSQIFSQSPTSVDPLARARDLVNSSEIILIWSQGPTVDEQYCHQKMYDLDLTQPTEDQRLVPKQRQVDSTQIIGNKKLAVATGNFLGGSIKHLVAAWEAPDSTIRMIVPEHTGASLSWDTVNALTIPGPLMSYLKSTNSKIHLATGNFFGDQREEIVIAYLGNDTSIHLQVCSFDNGSLIPVLRGSIADERTMPASSSLDNWDIAVGDFDGDGYSEVVAAFIKPVNPSWRVYAKIYAVDGGGNILPKVSKEIYAPQYVVNEANVVVATGDFNHDAVDEIALGFCFGQGTQTGPDTYVYLV